MNPMFKLFVKVNTLLMRVSGGKIAGTMGGNDLVLLTTKGNKSGKPRTVPVMSFEDSGNVVVIASFGGAPTHPAWYKNIEKDPEVEVELRGRKFRARAEVASGTDRTRIWQKVVSTQPRFGEYQTKAQGREIPVVVLKEAGAAH